MKIKRDEPRQPTYTLKVSEVEIRELSFALYILAQEHYDDDEVLKKLADSLHTTINEALKISRPTNG